MMCSTPGKDKLKRLQKRLIEDPALVEEPYDPLFIQVRTILPTLSGVAVTYHPVKQHLHLWLPRSVFSYHDPSSCMCPIYPPLIFL